MNPYATIDQATAYFATRLHSGLWAATNPTDKLASLVTATRIIDRLNFAGKKYNPNQELEWPRLGNALLQDPVGPIDATDKPAEAFADGDGAAYIGSLQNDTDISMPPVPTDILIACYEIAYALLDGVDPEQETDNLAVVSEGYSSVRSTYNRVLQQQHLAAGVPSMTAWRYLLPYLRDNKGIKLSRVS